MDYKYILRDIKLSKLTEIPMSTEASKLVKFWGELWADMKVQIDTEKGEIKCWKDDYDYYYFRQDGKNENLWCDRYRVWSFFRCDLGLEYAETQELIQFMVDKTLNCEVSTPVFFIFSKKAWVDKTLNCEVSTPRIFQYPIHEWVDKTLNCEMNNQ